MYLNLKMSKKGQATAMDTPLPAGLQLGDEEAEPVKRAFGSLPADYQNAGTAVSLNHLRKETRAY
ncbi:MAG: hypothetical protein RMK97_04545 [Sutterellaceae bacterium]|nr:hypothetical protein [Burkholderiaceae bacterium]MCX7900716.1 hypothetical protein [Burkholderiaceae bacterium]MDW8429761.1 hypothetical protein [Sutterellaceae bacterium]